MEFCALSAFIKPLCCIYLLWLVKVCAHYILSHLISSHLISFFAHSRYTQSYESLARRGLRVLALAYKKVDLSATPRPLEQPRSWVESGNYQLFLYFYSFT